jgi:hypothetical protein
MHVAVAGAMHVAVAGAMHVAPVGAMHVAARRPAIVDNARAAMSPTPQ